MIIIRYLINLLLFTLVTNLTWGQFLVSPDLNKTPQLGCGTELTQGDIDYLNSTRELREEVDLDLFRSASPSEPVTIPIFAHVLTQNGVPVLGLDMQIVEVDQAIARLNTLFDGTLIQFQRCAPVNYISETLHPLGLEFYPTFVRDDLNVGNNELSVEFMLARHEITDEGAINIFFSRDLERPVPLGDPPRDICGTSSFPSHRQMFQRDWILMRNECAEPSSLAHEMGHYFNLLHTFEGALGLEFANGSNCGDSIGDELCDTPADPQGLCFANCDTALPQNYALRNCNAEADCILDPTLNASCNINEGQGVFNPDTDNIMSYNWHICRTNFTDGQIERMQRSLLFDRRYLNNECDCMTDQLINNRLFTDDFIMEDIEASNSITTINFVAINPLANVKFDAGNVICLNPGFIAEYESVFLGIIDGCVGEFRISNLGLAKNSMITFNILPNPFSEQCTIVYNLNEDNLITITVSDIVGKKITTLLNNEQKQAGQQKVTFDANNLPVGIYYCTIQAGNHIETQKMVLTK